MKKNKNSSIPIPTQSAARCSWLWWFLLFKTFGGGGMLLWFFSLPYPRAQATANWLSPNHQLASFTSEVFAFLQPIGWSLSGVFAAAGICLLVFQSRTRVLAAKWLTWLARHVKRLGRDCTQLWQDYRPHRSGLLYLAGMAVLMAAAVLVRILFLHFPMRYDESYTVVVFAMRPWLNLISDYSLPNNHIFHTVLVKAAISLFGNAPWAVRLPAFISGVLCVPAVYLLARQLYGRMTAMMSAGLTAALPMLISYSTNARGYSQYTLFSLILFSLAIYLSKHANLVGWGLFVLMGTAGFYTAPFMLFPFGAACLWLAASAAIGESTRAYGTRWGLLKYLFSAGIATVLGTLILYMPVIAFGTGLDSLVNNPFVMPLNWPEFWQMMGVQLGNTWANWNFDVPLVVQVMLAAGALLSLVFHHRVSRVKIPLQIVILLWSFAVLVITRRSPLDRIWLFLMPFWLMWACAGLLMVLAGCTKRLKRAQIWAVIACMVIIGGWSVERVHSYFPGWRADPGKVEQAAEFLGEHLTKDSAVAVNFPDDAQYWYYLKRLGASDEMMHQIGLEEHEQVFAVVNTRLDETPAHVLETHGLSPEAYQADKAELVYALNDQEIYLCVHR